MKQLLINFVIYGIIIWILAIIISLISDFIMSYIVGRKGDKN